MEPGQIRSARRAKGLSQEKLAETMQVDITTIYRWEAGIVEPSLRNLQHLRDILSKYDGMAHPLMTFLLGQTEATALIDREGVYRKANSAFFDLVGLERDQLIGSYAPACLDIWSHEVFNGTDRRPEQLAVSDIAEVMVVGSKSKSGMAMRHTINVVRQEQFSVVLVHRIELLNRAMTPMAETRLTRRYDPAD